MKRRTFLVGTGSTAIGGSALLGTGAFTRVESQRRAKIQVAKDAYAYLGLEGCPDSPNSSYTDVEDSGHLAIEMSPENPTEGGGLGVNSDSRSYFDRVFQICNNGKQEICVWIEDDEDWPRVPENYEDSGDRTVDFYVEDDPEQSIIGREQSVILDVGDCVCIGVKTNTKGREKKDQLLEDLDNEIVIIADEECPGEVGEPVPPDNDFFPRTIGWWRNWSGDCTAGGQADELGDTLRGIEDGLTLGDLVLTGDDDTCDAVDILGKRTIEGEVRANDAAYGLAAQLLAAKLNVEREADTGPSGTGDCEDVEQQIADGQALLDDIDFDGLGTFLTPGADRRQEARDIEACLDDFNNRRLEFQE